ncbi:hypothetical protein KCG44_09155 [Pacificimonas sp. WHA3]|uniref:Flagellar hook-length control protein-like C-terminal domain-containing protein n=1 Tax=Pacificimonas pallii TaxID=2827236 RepID=A0ABS6SEV9_9SPHN|nr:hypothetical protein [Pacificimonas pallii]MBV7256948.1 hypothetical protein [Pacificimonas pallii]
MTAAPPPSPEAEPAPRAAPQRPSPSPDAVFRFSEALGSARRQVPADPKTDAATRADQQSKPEAPTNGDDRIEALDGQGARQEGETGGQQQGLLQNTLATLTDNSGLLSSTALPGGRAGSADMGAMIDKLFVGEAMGADGPDQLVLRFNQAIAPVAGVRLARTDEGTMQLVIAAHAGDRVRLQADAQRLRERLIARGHRVDAIEFETDPDPAAQLGVGARPA